MILRAVPYLRLLVGSFPPRRPGFDSSLVHAEFVGGESGSGADFSEYLGFPLNFNLAPCSIFVYHPMTVAL